MKDKDLDALGRQLDRELAQERALMAAVLSAMHFMDKEHIRAIVFDVLRGGDEWIKAEERRIEELREAIRNRSDD